MTPNQRRRWRRKQQRRERRRVQRVEKRCRPLASRILDPLEIVLRVLMACGLPEELARIIIFDYHALMRPTAQALTSDRMFRHMPAMFDTWDGPIDLDRCCCGMSDHDHYDEECLSRSEEWYVREVAWQRKGFLRPSYGSPVSLVAACHTRTIYPWRGVHITREFEWMEDTYGNHPDVQIWEGTRPCAHTRLWHRVWANMRGIRTPVPAPREFSFVRWLKEVRPRFLAEAIEINRGRGGCCVGGTRTWRAAVLMGELEWHSAAWWGWNRCRLNQQEGFI